MSTALQYLNSRPVKEGIKNSLGAISFAGGLAVIPWMRSRWSLDKTLFASSILLNAILSRPGLYLTERTFLLIATSASWASIFGENTIFEVNPRHPRHIANILAGICLARAICRPVSPQLRPAVPLVAFNFFTGRSTLHLANDLSLYIFHIRR